MRPCDIARLLTEDPDLLNEDEPCPICKSQAYVGGGPADIECSNRQCKFFSQKQYDIVHRDDKIAPNYAMVLVAFGPDHVEEMFSYMKGYSGVVVRYHDPSWFPQNAAGLVATTVMFDDYNDAYNFSIDNNVQSISPQCSAIYARHSTLPKPEIYEYISRYKSREVEREFVDHFGLS